MPKLTFSKFSWLLLALVIIGAGYFLLRPWWRLPFDRVHPFNAVIESAGMAIGIPTLLQASDTDSLSPWDSDRQALQDLINQTDLGSIDGWRSWWLVPQRGAETTVFTFIGDAEGGLSSYWSTLEYGPAIEHEAGNIYSWPQGSSARIYFAKYQNLLILGRLPLQVETALTAIQSNQNWLAQPGVKGLIKNPIAIDDPADWRLILNKPNWDASWPELDPIKSLIPSLDQQEGWALLSFYQEDSLARWQGRWVPEQDQQRTEKSESDLLFLAPLPETVGQVTTQSTPHSNSAQWQQYIAPWVSDELLFGQLNGGGQEVGQQDFWILPIRDRDGYLKQVEQLVQQEGVTDRREYQAFTLQQTLSSGLLQPLSDRRGLNPWWVQIEDFVVFSVSREVLERFVDYHILGGYLTQQPGFLDLASHLSHLSQTGRYNYRQWTLPDAASEGGQLFYGQDWLISGHILSRTVPSAAGGYEIEAWIKSNPITTQNVALDWSVQLESSLPLQLLPVLNANQEVIGSLVQDDGGQLWRLSADGQILWTTNAPQLYSPTYELTFSENEIGLVAASVDQLHCWNTDGDPLAKFPHLTTGPATAPTVVQFYAGTEEWVLFQPTAVGSIIAVNQDGSFLSPWNPLESTGVLRYPLKHVQLPDKDLIMGMVDSGRWQVWNRQGEMRFSQEGLNAPLVGEPQVQRWSDEGADPQNRWAVVDEAGRAQILTFAGESFPIRLGRGPADRFLFNNAWGDERADFWVQRASLLHLFGYEGTQLAERWQYRFDQPVDTLIAFRDHGALVVSNVRQQLFLINGEGQLVPGFPLAGEGTAIPIWRNEEDASIITSVDATVYTYRLNGR